MATTNPIPRDPDSKTSDDVEAARLLSRQAARQRTTGARTRSNGNTSAGGTRVSGGAKTRGGAG